jgi:hypothetical protein
MAADATQPIEYDTDTLQGLSDHVMVQTTMALPQLEVLSGERQVKTLPEKVYRWVEGTCVQNYAKSA